MNRMYVRLAGVVAVLATLSVPARGAQVIASVQGAQDDSEEDVRDGTMYMDSSDLELMNDGNEQVVGIRFPSVPVPPHAHITEAHILFDTDEIRPGQSDQPVTIAIHGEANAMPAPLADSAYDLSHRTPTRSSVQWEPEASVAVHDELYTPDIKSIVSEITSMSSWRSGNPLMVIMTQVSGSGVRWVESHRTNNGIDTPALVVTFDGEAGVGGTTFQLVSSVAGRPDSSEENVDTGAMYLTSSDLEFCADGSTQQAVLIRFPSVRVQPRAQIVGAHILFDTDEIHPGLSDHKVVVAIHGEANVSPAPVTDTAFDVSRRTVTTASVSWKPGNSRSEHDEMLTPDIAEIVTEIISMPGWASGNPLAIIFTKVSGAGVRWAESSSVNNGFQTPALIIDLPHPPPTTVPGTRTRQVVASVLSRADDSEEDVNDGSMYMTSSDLELMNDGNEQVVGIRFPSVDVQAGAQIVEAHVLFSVDEVRPGQSDIEVAATIHGEASPNPAVLADTPFDLSHRQTTAASVSWAIPPSANVHDELDTPDIAPIIREIIGMPGWQAGNPLMIILTHLSGEGVRWVEASEDLSGVATPALILTVADTGMPVAPLNPAHGSFQVVASVNGRPDGSEENSETGGMYLTSSDYELCSDGHEQMVLIRFPSVDIQPNAVVTASHVLFKVDEIHPGQSDVPVSVRINGDANPNPMPVTDAAHDISSRQQTRAAVTWAPEASVNVGDPLRSADVSSIVTEIITTPGWRAGNAMGMIFTKISGDGNRWAESSDSNREGVMTPALVASVRYGPAVPPPPGPPQSRDIVVSNDAADCAEENVDTGAMYLTSSDLEFSQDGDHLQVVGIRFPSVPISATAQLHQCRLLFDVDEVHPGQSDQAVRVHISGEASVNSAPFSDTAYDISSRTATTAGVNWNIPRCVEGTCNAHDELQSPNLKTIVQEVIRMPGWQSGNPMSFIITHVRGSGVRWVESHRENRGVVTPALVLSNVIDATQGPPAIGISQHLVVSNDGADGNGGEENAENGQMYLTSSDYEFCADGDHLQVVGIRFPGVNVDALAQIDEAHILFDTDEIRPGQSDSPVTCAIHAEANANPAPTSTSNYDISSRSLTASSVQWSPESSSSAHDDLITPDLSAIITELIGMPGWQRGNAMMFIFSHLSGDGVRWAESNRENNGITTPALVIDYTEGGGGVPNAGACTAANVQTRSSTVTAACCADGSCDATATGFPASCRPNCARVFMPFWNSCSTFLDSQIGQQFSAFANQCTASLPSVAGCQVAQLTQMCNDMGGVKLTEICQSPCVTSAMAQWATCETEATGAASALVAEIGPFIQLCQTMGGGH